jgi:hypothetical protein
MKVSYSLLLQAARLLCCCTEHKSHSKHALDYTEMLKPSSDVERPHLEGFHLVLLCCCSRPNSRLDSSCHVRPDTVFALGI